MFKYNSESSLGHNPTIKITDIHHHFTRLSANNNYYRPPARTNPGLKRFSYVGPTIWKDVPTDFKDNNFVQFKNKYKKYLLEKYSNIHV